jgi:hypothetical protein
MKEKGELWQQCQPIRRLQCPGEKIRKDTDTQFGDALSAPLLRGLFSFSVMSHPCRALFVFYFFLTLV